MLKQQKIEIEFSNRHCHLSQCDAEQLGISSEEMEKASLLPLKVDGQFSTSLYLSSLKYPDMRFRVLIPFREWSQVEIDGSDSHKLNLFNVPFVYGGRPPGDSPRIEVFFKDPAKAISIPVIFNPPHLHIGEVFYKEMYNSGENQKFVEYTLGEFTKVKFLIKLEPSPLMTPIIHLQKDLWTGTGKQKFILV